MGQEKGPAKAAGDEEDGKRREERPRSTTASNALGDDSGEHCKEHLVTTDRALPSNETPQSLDSTGTPKETELNASKLALHKRSFQNSEPGRRDTDTSSWSARKGRPGQQTSQQRGTGQLSLLSTKGRLGERTTRLQSPESAIASSPAAVEVQDAQAITTDDPGPPPGAFRIRGYAAQDEEESDGPHEQNELLGESDAEQTNVPLQATVTEGPTKGIKVEVLAAKSFWRRRRVRWMIALLLVTMGGVVGLTVGLTRSSSPSPTVYIPAIDRLQGALPGFAIESLQRQASPQSQALAWLSSESAFEHYDLQQLVQRFALATFYYATQGDRWTNNFNWLSDSHECSWYQAKPMIASHCADGTTYRSLSIRSNSLNGTIPEEVALLSELEMLSLSQNPDLHGQVPTSLAILLRLTQLRLTSNRLTGNFPFQVNDLPLKELDLSMNGFVGTLPSSIGNLTLLESLRLGSNFFHDHLPSELGSLSSLTSISLASNKFSGLLPGSLGGITNLVTLNLALNSFSGALTDEIFSGWTKLQHLDLSSNAFRALPDDLAGFTALTELNIYSNTLRGSFPASLGALSQLEVLDLSFNELTGRVDEQVVRGWQSVRRLALSFNLLSGTITSAFGSLTELTSLTLDSNRFTSTIPSEFGLSPSLTKLYLSSNFLSGNIPLQLSNVDTLTALHVNANALVTVSAEICNWADRSNVDFVSDQIC